MTDQELEAFSDYFVKLCELDVNAQQKLIAIFPEHVADLRRHDLDEAKEALRQMLKGKPPFGVSPKLSRVIGLMEERRKEENAGKAKYQEYKGKSDETFREESRMLREVQAAWDALPEPDRIERVRQACESDRQRGIDEFFITIRGAPRKRMVESAMLTFARKLQEVSS